MKSLEKLEALAERKRQVIQEKQQSLKKDMDALKAIEAEIDTRKGEVFREDINKLNLTKEEFDNFRKCVLSSKANLLEVMDIMSEKKYEAEERRKTVV